MKTRNLTFAVLAGLGLLVGSAFAAEKQPVEGILKDEPSAHALWSLDIFVLDSRFRMR